MPLLLLVILLPLVLIALMPLILIQRYRVGTARRMARSWTATFNVVLMAFSAISFLAGAAMTAVWVPNAFTGAAAGVGTDGGCVAACCPAVGCGDRDESEPEPLNMTNARTASTAPPAIPSTKREGCLKGSTPPNRS